MNVTQMLSDIKFECFQCKTPLGAANVTGVSIDDMRINYHCPRCENIGYRTFGAIGITGLVEYDNHKDRLLHLPVYSSGRDVRMRKVREQAPRRARLSNGSILRMDPTDGVDESIDDPPVGDILEDENDADGAVTREEAENEAFFTHREPAIDDGDDDDVEALPRREERLSRHTPEWGGFFFGPPPPVKKPAPAKKKDVDGENNDAASEL